MQKNLKRSYFLLPLFMAIYCAQAQKNSLVREVVDYYPAPGQFVNTVIGCPSAATGFEGTDNGSLTLGGFGGYVVFSLNHAIINDPQNPYGVDFTIYGNATENSSEPATVWVMADSNQNGLPDETWYALAGSDYWFSTSKHNYRVTYQNPGGTVASDVPWTDNQGNSGTILANEFHLQPYYPMADSFPAIDQQHYSLNGEFICPRIDSSNMQFIIARHYPFGYADNTPRNLQVSSSDPDNPYTSFIEGAGGDAFDISWAVDGDGNYIDLDSVNFIKIQNSVNVNVGWIGELSTEIIKLVDVSPDKNLTGDSLLVLLEPLQKEVTIGSLVQLNGFYFDKGRMQPDHLLDWTVSDTSIALVSNTGLFEPLKEGRAYVYISDPENTAISDSILIPVITAANVNENLIQELKIYPNPASIFIYVESLSENCRFSIINSMGKPIKTGLMDGKYIDISAIENGCYFLIAEDGKRIKMTKFIKLK
jgi:hypothetical protein